MNHVFKQYLAGRFIFYFLFAFLFACQPDNGRLNEQISSPVVKKVPTTKKIISTYCKAPMPVHDIWKLEPILIKRGEITPEMPREQKEKTIRAYIARKNKRYQICLKGVKTK